MESTLRLFKALPITKKVTVTDEEFLKKTLSKGFVVSPEVLANYPDRTRLMELIDKVYGRDAKQLNQTFHKSWNKVAKASDEQLLMEQLVHYFTTYGFESMGLGYNEESVFVPAEQLDVPELKEGIRLVVIKGYTYAELKEKVIELAGSGVALSQQTVDDIMDVVSLIGLFLDEDVDKIKNKEVKAELYDYLGITPSDPVEFLRFIVFRATGKTLLIKNADLLTALKGRNNMDVARYFDTFGNDHGLDKLARIFYRYKPIFLAFRTNPQLKRKINAIRRLAVKNHVPMKADLLNSVTGGLAKGYKLDGESFQKALDNASVFRKIRLAYALKFRTTDADSILYRVRNGKSYAKEFHFDNKASAENILLDVMKSVCEDIRPNVEGKKFYIPEGINYGVPATEKQFTGNLPAGTYALVEGNMVAGIHWENQNHHRIDLDLSITNENGKIGWDAAYRNDAHTVLFSGDLTDAPVSRGGASELFYFDEKVEGVWSMWVNYFNYNESVPVPFKVMVANQVPAKPSTHYTIDPNCLVVTSNGEMKEVRQKQLGIIVCKDGVHRFFFAESNIGAGISVRNAKYAEQARKFLFKHYTDSINFNELLESAGAVFVDTPEEADIDLSPEAVDKTTILSLLQKAN